MGPKSDQKRRSVSSRFGLRFGVHNVAQTGPESSQKSAKMSSKSLFNGSFCAQLKRYKNIVFYDGLGPPGCPRAIREHLEPPRSDKEDSMRRLRQRAPKRDRKRAKNEPQEGPRNESEMSQKRRPKRGPKMVCESLLTSTQLGPAPESVRALILCNV